MTVIPEPIKRRIAADWSVADELREAREMLWKVIRCCEGGPAVRETVSASCGQILTHLLTGPWAERSLANFQVNVAPILYADGSWIVHCWRREGR